LLIYGRKKLINFSSFWLLDSELKGEMADKNDREKLAKLCEGILSLDNLTDPSYKENTVCVKRALDGLGFT